MWQQKSHLQTCCQIKLAHGDIACHSNHHLALLKARAPAIPREHCLQRLTWRFLGHLSTSLWWQTCRLINDWLAWPRSLAMWIINLPLGLTCWYGRQRLASPAVVVTTSLLWIKLSASYTVSVVPAFVSPFAFFSLFSQKTHSGQRDAGRVRGRYMPGEWGAAFNCILLFSIWNWCLWRCQFQPMHKPLGLSHRLICHCPQPELATIASEREAAEICLQFVATACFLWPVAWTWPVMLHCQDF